MKLLCDACQRLLPPASWTVEDGALHVVCAGCGATAVAGGPGPAVRAPITARVTPPVEAAVTASVTPAVEVPVTPGGTPLVSVPATAGEPVAPGSTWLDGEWAALEGAWDDPEAHRRLLARAEALGDLAALGRRYKARLDAAPADAAAARARDELLKRATARLLVAPGPPPGGANAKNVVLATVLLTAVGLLAVLLVKLVQTAGAP